MFLGQYQISLDDDHRLVIPKPFRDGLAEGAYITCGFEKNLLIMTDQEFQEVYKRVAGLNIADPLARLLLRLIIGNASRLDINESGQAHIPPALLSFAGLEKNVVLVGQGNFCEAWAPAHWEEQSNILLDTVANSARFAQLNLALR